ncbi:MAG: IclR family transcriptional regulator [Syntrophomonadaceae bacterium]|jgi:IclR family KDG regulon transcriptional repressor
MEKDKKTQLLQSAERTLQILTLFSEQKKEYSLTEISHQLNTSKQVALKSLKTLEHFGFVKRNEKSKMYSLGFQLIRLGHIAQQHLGVRSVAHPFLANLSKELGESVYLLIPDLPYYQAICIDSIESPQTVVSRFRMAAPLYAGASKKVILAYLGEDYLNSMLENITLVSLTKNTVVDRQTLIEQLADIRQTGYCISYEETTYDAGAVAAPIFDYLGIVGSVAVYVPLYRLTQEKIPFIIKRLLCCTQEISEKLGYWSKKEE